MGLWILCILRKTYVHPCIAGDRPVDGICWRIGITRELSPWGARYPQLAVVIPRLSPVHPQLQGKLSTGLTLRKKHNKTSTWPVVAGL